jgi:hypothetical protein
MRGGRASELIHKQAGTKDAGEWHHVGELRVGSGCPYCPVVKMSLVAGLFVLCSSFSFQIHIVNVILRLRKMIIPRV